MILKPEADFVFFEQRHGRVEGCITSLYPFRVLTEGCEGLIAPGGQAGRAQTSRTHCFGILQSFLESCDVLLAILRKRHHYLEEHSEFFGPRLQLRQIAIEGKQLNPGRAQRVAQF